MRVLWVEGALLRSLERHSRGGSAREEVFLGAGGLVAGDMGGFPGTIPKAPRRDHKGQVGRGDSKCDSPPCR